MSILYQNIAKAVALRAGQLADGADSAALEAAFTGPLAGNMDGVEVPFSALKMAILASEKRIAQVIGFSSLSIYRAALQSRTIPLASGDDLPNLDQNEIEIVGELGGVFDATDNEPLTEITKQEIRRWRRNASVLFRTPVYHFHKEDTTIIHTRDAAYFKCCVWDEQTQSAAYDASGASPLPQGVETFWIADVLANLPQEDWFVSEAGIYQRISYNCEMEIKGGAMPSAKLPDAITFADPSKN